MNTHDTEARRREQRIAGLSDQEALAIIDAIAGETAEIDSPAGEREQASALLALFTAAQERVDLSGAAAAQPPDAAAVARELLGMMAGVPELRPAVDEWLEKPPGQEAMSVPLILAAPAVFAGCIALLQVVGHVRFRRDSSGKWEFEYDPTKKTGMDGTLRDAVKAMAGLMRRLGAGRGAV
jgi:hypothetical protein